MRPILKSSNDKASDTSLQTPVFPITKRIPWFMERLIIEVTITKNDTKKSKGYEAACFTEIYQKQIL